MGPRRERLGEREQHVEAGGTLGRGNDRAKHLLDHGLLRQLRILT